MSAARFVVKVVKRTRSEDLRQRFEASQRARCIAATVLPVPAPPDTNRSVPVALDELSLGRMKENTPLLERRIQHSLEFILHSLQPSISA